MIDEASLLGLCQALSLLMSVTFFGYVVIILVPFLRARHPERGQSDSFQWHLFVPCRDEEAVVDGTIRYLTTTFPYAHVWIIDDASEDETGVIAHRSAAANPHVHVVDRRLPNARQGKGAALNQAYFQLDGFLTDTGADRRRVVVGVVDADGAPSPDCLDVVSARRLFGNPEVGGVQIEVRMNNCDERPPGGPVPRMLGRLLVRMQDIEFRTVIAAVQYSRRASNTVGLGGNGQFTRLAALDDLRDAYGEPWHGSLLEDFELGVHLLLKGWRNAYTAAAYVEQEGLFSPQRFIVQRTRWGQGVMQCVKYLPALWASRRVSHLGAIEAAYYLMQPWLTLVGTVVYSIPVAVFGYALATIPGFAVQVVTGWTGVLLACYAFFGIGIFAMWGVVYRAKVAPHRSVLTGLGWGLAYFVYVYGFYITTWRAFFRIVARRGGWAKTRRNAEIVGRGPVALDR
jgi:1,2-diacylglycerol 3-beta-glucosyltransferase